MSRFALLLLLSGACNFSGPEVTPLVQVDAGPEPDAPIVVLGACDAVGIVADANQTCARAGDGSAYCWGESDRGQLGVAPRENLCAAGSCSPAARKLTLSGVTTLGLGGYGGCATAGGGTTSCWGLNAFGEYGDGSLTDQNPLGTVAQRAGATAIAGGVFHMCSLAAGHVSCSGKNDFGEVGNGAVGQVATATDVVQGATSLGVGTYISCAIDATAGLSCWGRNDFKQIDPTQANKLAPTKVAGLTTATQVVAGVYHLCVVHADHSASCWGGNAVGQLGTGVTSGIEAPSTVLVPNVVELSAGLYHTCARDAAGAVWCFGENYTATPTKIALPAAAIAVTSGDEHDCAVTSDHRVFCWGANNFGQLGSGTSSGARMPAPVLAKLCP